MKRVVCAVAFCFLLASFSVYAADANKIISPDSVEIKKFTVKISTEYLSPKVASIRVSLQFSTNPAPSGLSSPPMSGENNHACSASSGEACVISESKSDGVTFIRDYWPGNKNYESYNFNAIIKLNQMDSSGAPITSPVYQSINCLPASGTFNNESNEVTVFVAANGMCVISMN